MPHLHLEYSANLDLDAKPVLLALNQAMRDAAYVQIANDVKSRAVPQDCYVIGVDADSKTGYVHLKVSLLSGRSTEQKAEISNCLLQVLQQTVPTHASVTLQLCVEIIEIPKESYAKVILPATEA